MKTDKPTCQHPHLKYESGTLYLVCDDCKYVYVAVGHCKARIIQDLKARSNVTLEGAFRSDPAAPPRIRFPSSKIDKKST